MKNVCIEAHTTPLHSRETWPRKLHSSVKALCCRWRYFQEDAFFLPAAPQKRRIGNSQKIPICVDRCMQGVRLLPLPLSFSVWAQYARHDAEKSRPYHIGADSRLALTRRDSTLFYKKRAHARSASGSRDAFICTMVAREAGCCSETTLSRVVNTKRSSAEGALCGGEDERSARPPLIITIVCASRGLIKSARSDECWFLWVASRETIYWRNVLA